MRILRVKHNSHVFYASMQNEELLCLNKELGYTEPVPLKETLVLPPVAPTKVICVALNYLSHAEEVGKPVPEEPLLFLKPPSAIIGSGQTILLPPQSQRVDYEGELAIIIGKPCRDVALKDAADCIFGYSCANDVTARDLQNKDTLFARAKGFDSFAPIGPWIETEVPDPGNLGITTTVNNEVRQDGNTSDMIFKPLEILSFVSGIMTLLPGDVILTGTPPGIGPLKAGDEVRVEIEGLGLLINPVADYISE